MKTRRGPCGIALGAAILASACGLGEGTTAPRQRALVAVGHAADANGTPVKGANVAIQLLWPGRSEPGRGCTGSYLVAGWSVLTTEDGEFGLDMRLNPPGTLVCVAVYGAPPGDSVWRDSATVLTNLKTVGNGVQPDTARFDLRFSK